MSQVVVFPPERPLGRSVIALGAFDGVHLGHRALLTQAAADAHRADALTVAVTFDRDPDEVLHPEATAPRLLSADDRFAMLLECGADAVVVVTFTPEVAAMGPESFLDLVIGECCTPVAIHVGEGFRFGAGGTGDLDTLYVWGVEHNAEVRPHPLLLSQGDPVSATRIRSLIAQGDIVSANALLGRAHRVAGEVVHGRGDGASLGFATANVTPESGIALPADGVYAGRAVLSDGETWPAAISVGTPPSFPEAVDFLEAHLIGFSGDLYDTRIVLEFLSRLRDLKAFSTRSELADAIANDVRETRRHADGPSLAASLPHDDLAVIQDPLALERATAEVARLTNESSYEAYDESWVPVFGPHRMSTLFSNGAAAGALLTGPLAAAGIPFVWDPFPPEAAQDVRPDLNWMRLFTLLVPAERAAEARSLLPRGTANQ